MTTASTLIKDLRRSNGLTLRAFAQRIGTSSATLSNYEMGRKEPRLSTLERLVAASGATLSVEITPVVTNARRNDGRVSAADCSKNVSKAINAHREDVAFRVCLELIDDLSAVTPFRLLELTSEVPRLTEHSHYDALIAAIVESVCVQHSVRTPAWVYEPTRTTERWYLTDVESLREDADRDTPPIFRRHGVFILEDELSRA